MAGEGNARVEDARGEGQTSLVSPWPDLVFHVLAHMQSTAHLASSLYDARYVAFCDRHIGAATARPLGDDVRTLEALLKTHASLGAVQCVAWLFADIEAARAAAKRDLNELLLQEDWPGPVETPLGEDTPIRRAALRALGPILDVAEVVRAAAELEAAAFARLPAPALPPEMPTALSHAATAAPRLTTLRVSHSRALCRHGRVHAPHVYVGVPAPELDVSVTHVAMQAAHEATVLEVQETGAALSERDVEYAALLVFAERARGRGLGPEHTEWWRTVSAASFDAFARGAATAVGDVARRVLSSAWSLT